MRNLAMLSTATLLACAAPAAPDRSPTSRLYAQALELAADGDLERAYSALAGSLISGYATPSDVLVAEELRPLLADPEWRRQVRALLRENARESSLEMVYADEPGEPLLLTLRVVDELDGAPIPGTVVDINHTDARGYYERPGVGFSPRLFSSAVTDASGRIVVRTIRPGHYPPGTGADDDPAHVHFGIDRDDYIPFHSEILFDDDPRLAGDALRHAVDMHVPIAEVTRDEQGLWHASVTIPLHPLSSRTTPSRTTRP